MSPPRRPIPRIAISHQQHTKIAQTDPLWPEDGLLLAAVGRQGGGEEGYAIQGVRDHGRSLSAGGRAAYRLPKKLIVQGHSLASQPGNAVRVLRRFGTRPSGHVHSQSRERRFANVWLFLLRQLGRSKRYGSRYNISNNACRLISLTPIGPAGTAKLRIMLRQI